MPRYNVGTLLKKIKSRRSQAPPPPQPTPSEQAKYGANYKSPYGVRAEIPQHSGVSPNIPPPPPPPPRKSHVSPSPKPVSKQTPKKQNLKSSNPTHHHKPVPKKKPKKPKRSEAEISGYFVSQRSSKKRGTHLSSTSSPPLRGSVPEGDPRSSDTPSTRGRRITNVTFQEVADKVNLPHRRLSFRDGSVSIQVTDITSIPIKDFTEDTEDSEEDQVDDTVVVKLDKSLDQIRNVGVKVYETETLKEYNIHRYHFAELFVIYILLSCISCTITFLFTVKYNYGFTYRKFEDEKIMANKTIELHEKSRIYLNAHMLSMVIPTTNLIAVSTLTYRIFSNTSRNVLKWFHGTMNIVGSIFNMIGIYFAVSYHNFTQHKPHFHSVHSYIGIIAFANQMTSLISGSIFVLPCFNWYTRIHVSKFHRTVGSILLMGNTAAILTGCVTISHKFFDLQGFPALYQIPYYKLHDRSILLNLVGIGCMLSVGIMIYLQTNFLFRHRRRPIKKKQEPAAIAPPPSQTGGGGDVEKQKS